MTHSRIRPEITDPYPGYFGRVTDFNYNTPLILGRFPEALAFRKTRESSYVVMKPYNVDFLVDGIRREVTVPAGMLTDLTSVPRLARIAIGRVGPHLEAAIVHDYLYIAWQLLDGLPHKDDWRFANAVMFAGMKAAKVKWIQRMQMEATLRSSLISWPIYKSRDDGEDGLGLFIDVT